MWHNIYKTLGNFKRGCKITVRNKKNTYFWHDRWLGEIPLVNEFPHLFKMARSKTTEVLDLYTMNGLTVEWDLRIRTDCEARNI